MGTQYIFVDFANDYYSYSLPSINDDDSYSFINTLPYNRFNGLKKLVFRIHNNSTINSIIHLPFRSFWCSSIVDKTIIRENDNLVFICSPNILNYEKFGFFEYIRTNYIGSKIVCMFCDTYQYYSEAIPFFSSLILKNLFDAVITYNRHDANMYGFKLMPYYIPKYDTIVDDNSIPKSDVFFVGRDKGRLGDIYSVFEKCKRRNLKCDFNVIGIPPNRQRYQNEIKFNKYMKYDEVLKRIKQTRCVLNIIQKGASGITLRDYEAISFNKFLITNNDSIHDAPFFSNLKVIDLEKIDIELQKMDDYYDSSWPDTSEYSTKKWFSWLNTVL